MIEPRRSNPSRLGFCGDWRAAERTSSPAAAAGEPLNPENDICRRGPVRASFGGLTHAPHQGPKLYSER
jgi:hypothetical protein